MHFLRVKYIEEISQNTDAQNGILTLNKVVRGADEIEINVTVVEQTDGTFKFQVRLHSQNISVGNNWHSVLIH